LPAEEIGSVDFSILSPIAHFLTACFGPGRRDSPRFLRS
jgi:hypothetical protein